MSELGGVGFVLGALTALIVAVKQLQVRSLVSAEFARKLVHTGMGMICLTFPWLFQRAWPVWLLAGLAIVALLALRLVPLLARNLGSVLHGVERASYGEVYFPISVATVFSLSVGKPLAYAIPVALLTFADAAGALIGRRFGVQKYQTLEGEKTVEGSLAVCLAAFLCTAIPLLYARHDPREIVAIACLLALFAMILEAISWRGLDNVFLPVAAYAQLANYLESDFKTLFTRLLVLGALAIVSALWRRGQEIDDGARLGCILALYFFWAVGGWLWLVAPIFLIAAYVRLMPTGIQGRPIHNLLAVICVGSAGMPWAVAHTARHDHIWLFLFTVGIATQQAIIATVRFSQRFPHWPRAGWWLVGTLHSLVVQVTAYCLISPQPTTLPMHILIAVAAVAVATIGFLSCERALQQPERLTSRWWKQGISSIMASLIALALLQL